MKLRLIFIVNPATSPPPKKEKKYLPSGDQAQHNNPPKYDLKIKKKILKD